MVLWIDEIDKGFASAGGEQLKVGLAYDIGGRGDKSFNDSAAAGMSALLLALSFVAVILVSRLGRSVLRR